MQKLMIAIHSNTNLYVNLGANSTKDSMKDISNAEVLSNIEAYYQKEQVLPLNGGQFDSFEFNQKLNARIQNVGQVSESQMKEAKQFLNKIQESIMISFYKENQSFIDRAITAQENVRSGNANENDKVVLEEKNALRFLEVLAAFGGKELNKIAQDKENKLLFSLANKASNIEIQQQVFEYQQTGLFASGKYFFDLVFDTLPPSQQEEVLNALAVVHSYFSQNSLEIGSFKIEWEANEMGEWNHFEVSSLNQQIPNLESFLQNVSHNTTRTLFEILQNKEKLEQEIQNTPNSIMQTILKEAKEKKT